MKKIQISQTLKNIIVIVVIAVVFFFVGKIWPSGEEPTAITSDLLSQQIQSISELASVEYNYTNMGKFENQATFYGWKVPFGVPTRTKRSTRAKVFSQRGSGCIPPLGESPDTAAGAATRPRRGP